MVPTVSRDYLKFHEVSRNFSTKKNMSLIASTPITKSHIYCLSLLPLWNSFSAYLKCWAAVLMLPKINLTLISHLMHFILSQQILALIVMFHLISGGKFKYQVPGLGNFWGGFFPFSISLPITLYSLPTLYFMVPKGGNKNVIDFNCWSCSTEGVSRSETYKLAV